MALLKACIPKTKRVFTEGFTVLEILIVIAIFSILATATLFVSFDFYKGSSFRSERDLLVSLLAKARSDSMNNIDQTVHGLHIAGHSYTVFEGASYSASNPLNQDFTGNPSIAMSGNLDIIFNQLTAVPTVDCTVLANCSMHMASSTKQADISINNEGTIIW